MKITIKDNKITSADKEGIDFLKEQLDKCDIFSSSELYKMYDRYVINNTIVCKECGNRFFNTNCNATYCEKCKQQMGKIRYKNRKQNRSRFIHKEILDILYNLKIDKNRKEDFRKESNYYWGIINGEISDTNTNYKELIVDESDYIAWLLKTLNEVKLLKEII